jgi:hypothetical protein
MSFGISIGDILKLCELAGRVRTPMHGLHVGHTLTSYTNILGLQELYAVQPVPSFIMLRRLLQVATALESTRL